MKKVFRSFVAVMAIVCACFLATNTTFAYDDSFVRTSDGEPVGSEIHTSPTYQSVSDGKSSLYGTFCIMFVGLLVVAGVNVIISHSANKARQNQQERSLDLQEREVLLQEKRFASGDTSNSSSTRRPVVDESVSGTPASSLMGSVALQQRQEHIRQGQELNIPFQNNMF